MEEKQANGSGFGFPNPLCQSLRHVLEDNTPVDLPASVQRAEEGVSDCDRHLGWLVRVDDRNQKLEKSSLPVVPTVAHGIPVCGVDLVPETPFVVAVHPVRQSGTPSWEVVRIQRSRTDPPHSRAVGDPGRSCQRCLGALVVTTSTRVLFFSAPTVALVARRTSSVLGPA